MRNAILSHLRLQLLLPFFPFHSECKQDDPVILEKLLTGIYVSCHGSTDDEEERERASQTRARVISVMNIKYPRRK